MALMHPPHRFANVIAPRDILEIMKRWIFFYFFLHPYVLKVRYGDFKDVDLGWIQEAYQNIWAIVIELPISN